MRIGELLCYGVVKDFGIANGGWMAFLIKRGRGFIS